MSTANTKTGRRIGPWANLVICGGLSWGVNLWHALNGKTAGEHVNLALALLCATGPVVSAAFASHNMASSGGKWFKKTLTYTVFAMGMALSIVAQAEAVTAVFGHIALGVVFALMLDLSAFMSLHSIMSAAPVEAPAETPAEAPAAPPVEAPVGPPVGAPVTPPVMPPADRLPTVQQAVQQAVRQAPAGPPAQAPVAPPANRPKRTRQAPAAKTAKAQKMTREEAKAKAWELLKENPEMSAPDLARALGKSPTSGHVRDLKAKVLEEMRDAGVLPSVRAIGA